MKANQIPNYAKLTHHMRTAWVLICICCIQLLAGQSDLNMAYRGSTVGLNFSSIPEGKFSMAFRPTHLPSQGRFLYGTISNQQGDLAYYIEGAAIRDSTHAIVFDFDTIKSRIYGARKMHCTFFVKSHFHSSKYYFLYVKYLNSANPLGSLSYPGILDCVTLERDEAGVLHVSAPKTLDTLINALLGASIRAINDSTFQILTKMAFYAGTSQNNRNIDSFLVYTLQEDRHLGFIKGQLLLQTGHLRSFIQKGFAGGNAWKPHNICSRQGNYYTEYLFSDRPGAKGLHLLHKLNSDGSMVNTQVIDSIDHPNNAKRYSSAIVSENEKYVYLIKPHQNTPFDSIFQLPVDSLWIKRFVGLLPDANYSSDGITGDVSPNGSIILFTQKAGTWNYPGQLPHIGKARPYTNIRNPNRSVDKVKIELDDLNKGQDPIIFDNQNVLWLEAPLTVPDLGFVDFDVERLTCSDTILLLNLSTKSRYVRYQWVINGDTLTSLPGEDTLFYTPKKSGLLNIKLTGYKANGGFKIIIQTFDYFKAVKTDYLFTQTPGCQYLAYTYQPIAFADTVKHQSGYTWHWQSAQIDTIIRSNTLQAGSFSYVFNQAGRYDVKLVFSNGFCQDSISYQDSVVILPAPRPGIELVEAEGCVPFIVSAKRLYDDPIDSVVYQIEQSSYSYTTNQAIKHTILQAGQYYLHQKLYGPTGCRTSDSIQITVKSGFLSGDSLEIVQVDTRDSGYYISWLALPLATKYQAQMWSNNQWSTFYLTQDTFAFLKEEIPKEIHLRIVAQDTCAQTISSPTARNILLKAQSKENEWALLWWNSLSVNQQNPAYQIFTKDLNHQQSLINLQWIDTSFTDYLFFNEQLIDRSYRVVAYHNGRFDWPSSSNEVQMAYKTIVLIPNAFSPNQDGLNDVYKPILFGIDHESYFLDIYNRWGQLVFSTKTVSEGWDGKFKGEDAPADVYFYRLHCISDLKLKERLIFNKNGQLHLIR